MPIYLGEQSQHGLKARNGRWLVWMSAVICLVKGMVMVTAQSRGFPNQVGCVAKVLEMGPVP